MTLLVEAAKHIESAASLANLSNRGRFVPELGDSIRRELFVGRYRLIYRVEPDHVALVAFVHGARDFRPWWNRYRRKGAPN